MSSGTPFDAQDLQIELRQDDSRVWNHFDLVVCSVGFHRNSLQLVEWTPYEPKVAHGSHTTTTVKLRLKRISTFYVTNIVMVLSMLSLLAFIAFALPSDALGERVNIVLTLLLTVVAFKFALADLIPKVGYSTLLDSFVINNIIFLFLVAFVCTCTSFIGTRGLVFWSREISADTLACLLCVGTLLLIYAQWLVKVRRSVNLDERMIKVSNDRNWYMCVFANPIFFPADMIPTYE